MRRPTPTGACSRVWSRRTRPRWGWGGAARRSAPAGACTTAEARTMLLGADAPQHAVRAYQQHAGDRRALVFTPTVKVAHAMADAFAEAGVPAATIDAETPLDERREILAAFRRGPVRMIANCAVLTEGFDE